MKRKYTTISIPVQLYERIKRLIDETGFKSVSDYVLREIVAMHEMEKHLSHSLRRIWKRLRLD